MITTYRQGDVFLIEAQQAIPTNAKPVARMDGRIVLAYGEVTGHAHAILDRDVELLSIGEQADRWLRVGAGGATIRHEEHGAIALPPGQYEVRIQREYHPEAIRQVAD